MKKTVEVQFSSQSKSVTAQTSVLLEGDENIDTNAVLEEARALFAKAEEIALKATFVRNK